MYTHWILHIGRYQSKKLLFLFLQSSPGTLSQNQKTQRVIRHSQHRTDWTPWKLLSHSRNSEQLRWSQSLPKNWCLDVGKIISAHAEAKQSYLFIQFIGAYNKYDKYYDPTSARKKNNVINYEIMVSLSDLYLLKWLNLNQWIHYKY